MKFTALRRYIKSKDLSSPHLLGNCDLVIDGDSYFQDTYRNSGCQFVLGPDSDRYADFIIKKLRSFLDNDVKLYVIFSGVTKPDLDKRKDIHQGIIDDRIDVTQIDKVGYFQPLLVNDIQKQVLEEMNVKYFVCEYDSTEAIVGVARKFKCPVLTDNVEYSLFGVSCIPPNSVEHDNGVTKLHCKIYEHEKVKTTFGVYSKMPILLALLNGSGDYLVNLSKIIENGGSDVIGSVIRWVKHQREATLISTVAKSIDDEDQNKAFKEVYERIQILYLYPLCNLAVKYFQRDRAHGLFKDDKKWFAKGVSNGRIALPYINLKKKGAIYGSILMNDSKRPDALLAAFDIIVYSHCLLKNSQDSTITFLGRHGNRSSIKEIDTHWDKKISNRDIFTKRRVGKKLGLITGEYELFQQFLEEVLPGYPGIVPSRFSLLYNSNKPLGAVSMECWILITTLVYYIFKKNKDFISGAYCVLLSYFMLGPVSRGVDYLKKNGQNVSVSNSANNCVTFYNSLQFLFDKVNLNLKYNSSVVHNFSEFQHCLQHMNYLNKLCGEKIPCTIYHNTYNATFIYNTFLFMNDKDQLMKFLENKFKGSSTLEEFKIIVTCFENCLLKLNVFADNKTVNSDSDEQNK